MLLLSHHYLLWNVELPGWMLQDTPHPKQNPTLNRYCFCYNGLCESKMAIWQKPAQHRKTLTPAISLSISFSPSLSPLCVCVWVYVCARLWPTYINMRACCLFHFLLVKHIPRGDLFDSVLHHGRLSNKRVSRIIQTSLWQKSQRKFTIGYTKWKLLHWC